MRGFQDSAIWPPLGSKFAAAAAHKTAVSRWHNRLTIPLITEQFMTPCVATSPSSLYAGARPSRGYANLACCPPGAQVTHRALLDGASRVGNAGPVLQRFGHVCGRDLLLPGQIG